MTPNWFAAVMGTGIIAVVAAAGPSPLHASAHAFWILSTLMLIALTAAYLRRWIGQRDAARADLQSPQMFPFTGAIAMAVLTVGCATRTSGHIALGATWAIVTSAALWIVGTVIGVSTSAVMLRRVHGGYPTAAVPAWLMPVVPPMVSAATGAALLPHVDGWLRPTLLALCCLFYVVALGAAAVVGAAIYRQLRRTGLPQGPLLPTLWIPLGVIGQSIAAANLLADAAQWQWLHTFAVVYGIGLGVIGLVGLLTLSAVTISAFAHGLAFAPSWWSFTFPIGTCASGALALAHSLNSAAVYALGVSLWAVLCGAWAAVATATIRATVTAATIQTTAASATIQTTAASAFVEHTQVGKVAQTPASTPLSTPRPDCIQAIVPPATDTAWMPLASR